MKTYRRNDTSFVETILYNLRCLSNSIQGVFKQSQSSPLPVYVVTGRFAHFPVRPESFRPESFRPRVVSPSYPESFRPLFGESFRPLSKFIFYWGYCDKFTVFVSFDEDFGYISLKNDMSFIN